MNKNFKTKTPKVSAVCCTYGRFTCIERSLSMFLDQDYKNKELIIFNTALIPLILDESLENSNIRVVNNHLNYQTGLDYTNIGDVRRDALTHATGEVYICWDDDDTFAPPHISRGIKKLIECGKRAWKPKSSLFSRDAGKTYEYCENQMEASILVDINVIRNECNFKPETGSEHLSWIDYLRYSDEFYIEDITDTEYYAFVWGEPTAGHKQSGNINSPTNFEDHKKASTDFKPGEKLRKIDVTKYYYNMADHIKDIEKRNYFIKTIDIALNNEIK